MDVTPSDELDVGPEVGPRLTAYVAAIRASPHNLLSKRGLSELESRHVPECLGLAALIPDDARTVLDVGSGGGLPGMVIAIVRPDLRVTLLDATTKKVDFLRETADALGVDVETLNGRSEDLVRGRGQRFDVVTARAVAPLERLIGWTLPWVRPGGLLLAVKGEQWETELAAALPALRRVRARVLDVTTPGSVIHTSAPDAPDGVQPRVVIIQAPG